MEIEALRMAWRPRNEGARLVVGTVSRDADTFLFRYDGVDLALARQSGFQGYPGLPVEPDTTYNGRAMDAFRSRLPQPKRPDRERLLGLWGVTPDETDPFILLGATGGRLVTDAFEFLPVVRPTAGTWFLTPVAGFRYYADSEDLRKLPTGACFDLVPEPGNLHDPQAVRLDFEGRQVGYLRKVVSASVLRARTSGLSVLCSLAREASGSGPEDVVVALEFQQP